MVQNQRVYRYRTICFAIAAIVAGLSSSVNAYKDHDEYCLLYCNEADLEACFQDMMMCNEPCHPLGYGCRNCRCERYQNINCYCTTESWP
ncbi:hypothetical protein Pan14r_00220 [Crateriforma conspicua]|uniref:Uncharacterized protein n=1 Tax=Crateriforma conspicua TaxID=2527996 RepID=A0A5C5Y0K9_9PLAN|nr:hypothetical protein Mal65_25860 [Crateriforma conspicua]TWT67785.1 hypothetical protein Pan14r_00220 [Crateriforma conspicua]